MGRHAGGGTAGPPVLPPRSLLIALLAAMIVTAVILTSVALARHAGHGGRPAPQITDLVASPSPLLGPSGGP